MYILSQYSYNPTTVSIKEFLNIKFIKVLIYVISHFKVRKTEEALKAATTTTRSGRTVTKKVEQNFIDSSKLNFGKVNTALEDNLFSWIKDNVIGLGNDENSINDHYLLSGAIEISGMGNAVNSMAKEILKSYKQNITANFVKYIERFVNVCFKKKEKLEAIENSKTDSKELKKNKKNMLINDLRKIKNDLLNIDNDKLESIDQVAIDFVRQYKHCLLPNKRRYNHKFYIIIIYIIIYLFLLALTKTI